MKYIFLDIDGVLATDCCFYLESIQINDKLKMPYPWYNPSVESLNNIIWETDCKLIISSDWRKHYTLLELKEIFHYNGISPDRVIDVTGTVSKMSDTLISERTRQINTYVSEVLTPVDKWVVVDDLCLGFNDEIFINVLDIDNGLKSYELEVIEKLNK